MALLLFHAFSAVGIPIKICWWIRVILGTYPWTHLVLLRACIYLMAGTHYSTVQNSHYIPLLSFLSCWLTITQSVGPSCNSIQAHSLHLFPINFILHEKLFSIYCLAVFLLLCLLFCCWTLGHYFHSYIINWHQFPRNKKRITELEFKCTCEIWQQEEVTPFHWETLFFFLWDFIKL